MAKPLNKKQPRSSIDRLLDPTSLHSALELHEDEPQVHGTIQAPAPLQFEERTAAAEGLGGPLIARRSLQPVQSTKPAEAPRSTTIPPPMLSSAAPERTGEAITSKREFHLTRSADETMEELVLLYRRASNSNLTRSHVLRAILKVVRDSMPSLRQEAAHLGPLKRPSNAKGWEAEREEFEEALGEAFRRGIRG